MHSLSQGSFGVPFENIPAVLYVFDLVERAPVFLSAYTFTSLGFSAEEIRAYAPREFLAKNLHPGDARLLAEHFAAMSRSGNDCPAECEYRMRHRNGQWRWFRSTDSVYARNGDGEVVQIIGTAVDITRQKEAEHALREREEHYRNTVDFNPLIPWIADAAGKQFQFSSRWADITGAPSNGACMSLADSTHPEDRQRFADAWRQAVRAGEPFDVEHRVGLQDGSFRWMRSRAAAHRDDEERIVRWYGTTEDIEERKKSEEALIAGQKWMERVLDWIPTPVIMIEPGTAKISFANAAANAIAGGMPQNHPAEEYDQHYKAYSSTDGRALSNDEMPAVRLARGEELRGVEVDFETPNGLRSLLLDGRLLPAMHGHNAVCIASFSDVTGIKRTERLLRESKLQLERAHDDLRAVMDAVPAALFISRDSECRHIEGSHLALELMRAGPGANLSRTAPESEKLNTTKAMKDGVEIPEPELPMQRAAARRETIKNFEFDMVYADGSTRSLLGNAVPLVDSEGRPRGSVGAFVDITERIQTERKLQEAQKQENIGMLAGGIAHRYNNLLTGILGNASLALSLLEEEHQLTEYLQAVIKAGEEAAQLTQQMLAYSGRGQGFLKPLELSKQVLQCLSLIRNSVADKVEFKIELYPEPLMVRGDLSQIHQIITNLVSNAVEAIGAGPGTITITTGPGSSTIADTGAESHCILSVQDTGCGIAEAIRHRIFDPFFTTKFTGRGLGLAAVQGIVRLHKGTLNVESREGEGSTFSVQFPLVPRVLKSLPQPASPAPTGMEVLVVDDEDMSLQVTKNSLLRDGLQVLTASTGAEALAILRTHLQLSSIVIDWKMPGLSGLTLVSQIRAIRPDIRIIVCSGYPQEDIDLQLQGEAPISGFIQKPFLPVAMVNLVKALGTSPL